ncbi:MAG: acyl-CoA carboxylase subunit epsilon [Actinobacteria bacterium]|nr:acyl-CoA carboxylase subunit epsilon [Actinomycetota bacterium]
MSEPAILRVVSGRPTADELAAVLAIVTATTSPSAPRTRVRGGWSDAARQLRLPVRFGAGGWRSAR